MVDSVLSPDDQLAATLDVVEVENYVASTAGDTTGHGSDVLECAGFFAPDAEFETYRVVASDGTVKRGNLVAAIADASSGGTDVVNLSVGIHHREHEYGDCGGRCRVAEETRLAVESGTTVVAAAGNRKLERSLATHCPALLSETVSVGGFVARCTEAVVERADCGQYWVRTDELHGPFCGQRGCDRATSCDGNRFEQPWQGNVSFHNAAPDVLAPVHHVAGTDDEPIMQSGTSFGAGVVTGALAAVLSDCSADTVAPSDVGRAVRAASADIHRGPLGKLCVRRTRDVLIGE